MDRATKQKICDRFDISSTYLSEIPPGTMNRLKAMRDIMLRYPPPADSDTNLLVKTESGGWWYPLRGTVTIGSGNDADLKLDDKYLSRKHCIIDDDDDVWNIRDLDSSNGVYVYDQKVKEKRLTSGDIVQIGGTTLIFFDLFG